MTNKPFQEEWVETKDGLSHRYSLMEKWATADQRFRDSYHDRATADPSPAPVILSQGTLAVERFVCLAPVTRDSNQKHYTHLLKILILLYIVQDGYFYHPFSFNQVADGPQEQPQLQAGRGRAANTPVKLENLLASLFLRPADLRAVAMTRAGTALFTPDSEYDSIWYILDAESLDTGLLNVVQFKANGEIAHVTHWRSFNLTQIMIFYLGYGWPLKELIDTGIGGRAHQNQPLNLDLPILDILQGVKDRGEFQYAGWGSRELWATEIERAAPGFMKLESEGREGGFELEGLAELE
ncbi:hypothetical protein BDW74DRAFT_180056 [Aspergillus multicolor]|uniref:uncharacterized protein n=1 Tax=Aspergillus multicolor TaxID=41759 RepID=UPI003CCDBB6C